ncbi:hypothetical protein BJX61DRAFT_409115 [Aspergillus egyptiacus]|nr:hypothetical protein BJX61DRAFT_409115 [Aspergillus egyptiacus]
MSDETQTLSIQDRIRALKQAQAGQSADSGTPFLSPQPTAFALRPAPPQPNGVHNPPSYHPQPSPVGGISPVADVPPAPRAISSGISSGARQQQPKVPPPLPARKSSTQSAPALPPRRPSVDPVASDTSRTAPLVTKRLTGTKGTNGSVKAPPWGVGELPPLPPKRQTTHLDASASRPKSTTAVRNSSNDVLPPPRAPTIPARKPSNQSLSTVSSEKSYTQSPPPPQLPPRANRDKSPTPDYDGGELQARRLPPSPPSVAALNKVQRSGFEALSNKKVHDARADEYSQEPAPEASSAGASRPPPPVPLDSRPNLSATIQATKPRIIPASIGTAPASSTLMCLKCRDFSAPDAHAARYPRQSLQTQDLGWLANELTAPFSSLTDKARVIFTWLHHNIDYDTVSFYNHCVKPSTPDSTFASGLAVCSGYADLFAALATRAGLEAKVVSGHGKGYGYEAPGAGVPLPPYDATGHAWNVVRIDHGQWKLIDACWGAGHVQGPGRPYVRSFNPAMFTDTNDEFGLKHYPSDRAHFYRDDGRSEISWEEYILGNPNSPLGAAQPRVFGDAKKHSIGERSFRPASQKLSIRQSGPIRFQFNLICEHWSLERHANTKPGLFLLMIHGVDGRKDGRLPLTHWRGPGASGGGDVWYVDVPDGRALGAPGQKVQLAVLTKFGCQEDARGITAEEYQRQVGRVGMAWAYIAEWELVA